VSSSIKDKCSLLWYCLPVYKLFPLRMYLSLNSIYRLCMLVVYCCACHSVPLFYESVLILKVSLRENKFESGLEVAWPSMWVAEYVTVWYQSYVPTLSLDGPCKLKLK
jgi:hypothetical protein